MLNLVFGRTGYGKTDFVFSKIKALADSGNENIILLTPEQYSLIAERRLLKELGVSRVSAVFNGSFSRLSNEVKENLGSDNLPVLSKGGKAVLMLQAIDESKAELELFNKNLDSLNFVNSMVKIYDEMRSCNLSSAEIYELSKSIESRNLKQKMNDLSLIMHNYEAIICDRFLDPSDELTRLYNKLCGNNYFKDKYVFIDGFNGFVAQEYKILELIISEAKEVYITLCSDRNENENDFFSIFTYVNKSASIIKRIAEKAGIETKEISLETNYRSKSDSIKYIEKNLFSMQKEKVSNDKSVSLYLAKSLSDECDEASRYIRTLLRRGYRASDIAVIVRDIEKYRDELGFAFKKYDIPFFYDERQPVKTQPLVVFAEYLLRCVNYSLQSDDILSLAKTGLTELSDEEINELENYVYLWKINGSKWKKPFENSTKGFVDRIDENDRERLNSINRSREKLIGPIIKFKNSVKGKGARDICASIYYALIEFTADKRLKENAEFLYEGGHPALAMMQGRIWDIVMNVLDQMQKVLPDEPISLDNVAKLFSIIIMSEDLGVLPGGIDNVQLGQADRIRCDNPKAVLVLGANEGEFPQSVTSGGLLSESERRILLDNNFKLYSYGEIFTQQEKYFSYMALCAASEKLFVSYLGNTGKDSAPSEIVTSLEEICDVYKYKHEDIPDIDLVETYSNSLELMSKGYADNSAFSSSLKSVFTDDAKYSFISDIAENKKAKISDSAVSTKLFRKDMVISASRIEDYYNCPFRYFCKFGLNVRPMNKTEMDALKRGTLIHYVLEMILSEIGSKRLSAMEANEIIAAVDKYIKQYFETEMGNITNLPERFYYNYNRISTQIYNVVLHLALEFKECDFEAKAFELDIDDHGSVKPEKIDLPDGGSIRVRGSIDRVDTFDNDGRRYVRVIDYKSGGKEFDLSDIMYGLNLQMFIYLFCLCEDKEASLNGIPAGVLYMHANQKLSSYSSRRDADNNIADNLEERLKMLGIVISSSEDGDLIPGAMEHDLKGKFIPVMRDRKGNIIGSLASLEELGRIHRKVNDLIADMGVNLHCGNIERSPVKNKNHRTTCEYCDYKDVCANQRLIEEKVVDDLSQAKVMEILEKEYAADD